MSTASYFKTLGQIEDRVTARMTALRDAEREVAQRCPGMAFDGATAEDVYRAGLNHLGIAKADLSGMNVAGLRALLKHTPRPGTPAWRNAPAMAYDSKEPSVLDGILSGLKPPRDRSTRNDFLRNA
jgi:hypothetical protein